MSPKTASDPWPDDLHTAIALFRYGLIAQLIHDPPASGGQAALLREIAAKSYRIPGSTRTQVSTTTLRRYLKAYRSGGFDALRPVARADTGAPRAIPPDVLARAIALREEQPARTTHGGCCTSRRTLGPRIGHRRCSQSVLDSPVDT